MHNLKQIIKVNSVKFNNLKQRFHNKNHKFKHKFSKFKKKQNSRTPMMNLCKNILYIQKGNNKMRIKYRC